MVEGLKQRKGGDVLVHEYQKKYNYGCELDELQGTLGELKYAKEKTETTEKPEEKIIKTRKGPQVKHNLSKKHKNKKKGNKVLWASEYDPQEVYLVKQTHSPNQIQISKYHSRDGTVDGYAWLHMPARVNGKRELVKNALDLN
jgi:hypothetical protein